jgi:hypothetical protein
MGIDLSLSKLDLRFHPPGPSELERFIWRLFLDVHGEGRFGIDLEASNGIDES